MGTKYRSSLRFRLFSVVVLAAIPAVAVVLWTFSAEQHRATAGAEHESLHVARLTGHYYEQVASDARLLLGTLAQLPEVRDSDAAKMSRLFAEVLGQSSLYANLGAFDPYGSSIASAVPTSGPVNVSDRAYFKRALAERRFIVSEFLIGRVSGKASIGFAYPVTGEADRVLSVLYLGIDLEQLNQVVANADLPPGSTLTVIDHDGLVLVRHPEPEEWVGKSMPEAPIVKMVLAQKEGAAKAPGLDGQRRFYGFAPLEAAGQNGAYVVVGIPESIALGGVHQVLQRNLALLALSFLALFALVWLGSERQLLRPIRSLLGATRRMAEGDLGTRTGVAPAEARELGELAHAVDHMAESLEARQAEAKKAEEALSVSESRYREMAASIPGIVFQLRVGKDGSLAFTFVSEGVKALAGLSRCEVEAAPPTSLFEMIVPEDLARVNHTIAESARTLTTGTVEYRLMTPGREIKWVRSTANPSLLPDGSVLFNGVVLDITDRKTAEDVVQRRLQFEQVMAGISARFVDVADIDDAINVSLAGIGALTGAGRAYLFLFREGDALMDNTHEWCAEGVSPQIDNLKGLPLGMFPWWMAKLRKGEVIHIMDVSQLPFEAKAEKDILESQGIKSLLVLPVDAGGELTGFIGLDNVRHAVAWNDDDLGILRVSSEIIGAALGRSRAEQRLKDREKRLQALYDVGRGLARSLETQTLAQLALEEALKAADLDAGIIRHLDHASNELVLLTSCGLPPELEARMLETAGRVKPGQGFAGQAAQTGRPLVVEDIEGDARCLVPELAKFGFHSAAYLPLKAKDSVVGVISGYSKLKRTFKPEDMEVLTALGTMVGMAISNAQLFEQTVRGKREWERTFDSMSEGVAIISPERRILRANKALARMLGFKDVNELIGKQCHRLVHGRDSPPASCPTCACLMTKRSCEVVWQEPHLGGRWLSLRGDPMLDANGQVIQIVHTFADVSEEKKRQKALERLHDISQVLSITLDLREAMRLAVREVRDTFGGADSTVGIALLDDRGQLLKIAAALGPRRDDWEGVYLPLDQLLPEGVATLFQEHRPWQQADLARSSRVAKELPGFLEHRSLVTLPLVSGDHAIGVLFLARIEAGLPAADEMALLETCAGGIARAVHNAQLFNRTDAALRRRIAEQEALTGVLGAAAKSLDLDSVLRDALKRAAEALDADAAGIALADQSGQKLTVQSAYERKSDSYRALGLNLEIATLPSLQALIKSGQPIVIPDIRALPAGDEKAFAEQWRARSALVLPIVLAGRMLGTLQFTTDNAPKNYTADEVSLARAISNHLASVIENARLHERTEKERSTLESIIASMGEGLLVADASRNILYCNKASENLLDLRCEDFIGLSEDTFQEALALRVNDVDALRSRWKDALSRLEEKPKFGFEVKSGSAKRSIEATLFPVGHKNKRLGTGVLLRDVTREREIDRMKTEFISVASHELRTPMTSVYGFAELLLMRATGLTEDQRKWVQTIYQEGKRLSDIVEDLLNVSRIEAGRLSLNVAPVALRPLVTDIIDQLRPVEHAHSFEIEMPDGLPEVQADKDKLRQVLDNLIDNAVKYSPEGGLVKFAAGVVQGGRGVWLSLSDQGLGIPVEEISKLFTRFHRVQRPETQGIRGTGLGLYIVKSLVEMMGGRIWIESTVGKGSTFYVSLPCAESQTGQTGDTHA